MTQTAKTGPAWWRVLPVSLITLLAYLGVAAAALMLAGPPAYAAPLYPSAGVALAAVLIYGRSALPGVLLGALAANAMLASLRGTPVWPLQALPMVIAVGATAQAALGATLLRRHVEQPLVLNAPRDIFLSGMLGAVVACTVSPSVAVLALHQAGVIHQGDWLSTWVTWWQGDTLGVLIGAPLALAVIGQPPEDWRPRRRTLALPLLLALAMLAVGMLMLARVDRQRALATFERDADRLASSAQQRLGSALFALQALHSVARWSGELDQRALQEASRWWLAQPLHLKAMGHSVRLPVADVPAFESLARSRGLADYHVFDRDGGRAHQADGEVVALRHIEPAVSNATALGVNAMSIPAARTAIEATRRSGEPAATAGFRLTQALGDDTGVVLYQALYRGEPADATARRQSFRGVVFVTLNTEQALSGLTQAGQEYLHWCLVDPAPAGGRGRLAGPVGCETKAALGAGGFADLRPLHLAGRQLELRIAAEATGNQRGFGDANWLLSTAGLAAAAMLGALLLTVTGQNRRTGLAVTRATAELRHEIGERNLAEQALRDSEARLRSILDHAPLGVVFLDARGEIIDANKRLCEMLGSRAETLRGQLVVRLVHSDDAPALQELRLELLAGAVISGRGPLRLAGVDGPSQQIRVSASALRDDFGRVTRMVVVVEDVTEHLRLEASERALHRAEEANRAKNDFLSRMSHELRTPLNAMIGFTQLLQLDHKAPLPAHQQAWAQQILRAGWHLLEMINETLDLSRIESGAVRLTLEPVDLPTLVGGSLALVASAAAQRGVHIEEALSPGASTVQADATRLKQVLTNLLSNAIKYNQPGGHVVLRSRPADQGMVEIEVIDSGLGMTESQVDALFQPYNRLGRESSGIEGTGIGLVISRRLTELMGGRLSVQSLAGKGSTFTVKLPAAAAAQADSPRAVQPASAPYHRRLVYYVEDNETNVEVMRGVLAQRPQIEMSSSALGLDGLMAMRQRPPDLILLDMQLPDISGLELLRHIQQDPALATIAVIVVSADATSAHMEQALTLGAQYYVTKPLDVQRFLEIVDHVLEGAETRFGM